MLNGRFVNRPYENIYLLTNGTVKTVPYNSSALRQREQAARPTKFFIFQFSLFISFSDRRGRRSLQGANRLPDRRGRRSLPREPPTLWRDGQDRPLRFGEPLPREPPKLILRFGEPLRIRFDCKQVVVWRRLLKIKSMVFGAVFRNGNAIFRARMLENSARYCLVNSHKFIG